MSGLSDYTAKNQLSWLTGQVAQPALPSVWLALFTAVGIDAGTGFTEVTGGSYARQQVAGALTTNGTTAAGVATLNFASVPAWVVAGMTISDTTAAAAIPAGTTVLSKTATTVTMSANAAAPGVGATDNIVFSAFSAATGSAPSQVVNNAAIAFAQATASWGTALAFGFFDAAAAGNLLDWDYMGSFAWLAGTISAASPAVITAPRHGFANGDSFIYSTEVTGPAPTFSAGSYAGLQTVAGVTTDTLNVTGVNASASGAGLFRKVVPQPIPINGTASFAAGTLTLQAA